MDEAGITDAALPYAELHCISNFTFLRGASHPEELIQRAGELGYTAIAITDECSVAGVVRANVAAQKHGMKLIIGSEFRLADGLRIVLLAASRRGYGQLCELITRARRAAPKGEYRIGRDDFTADLDECLALWVPAVIPVAADVAWLQVIFADRLWLGVALLLDGNRAEKISKYKEFSKQNSLQLVACGDVHMHRRGRRALQDTLTAIRLGIRVDQVGAELYPNGERYLRNRKLLTRIYPAEWLAASVVIANRINFSLNDLGYRYPRELVPAGMTAAAWLRSLTEIGLRWRWPDGAPAFVRELVEYELMLIAELRYEHY